MPPVAKYETVIKTVTAAEPVAGQGGSRVITGRICRVRRRHAVAFVEAPAMETVPAQPVERPPRTAVLLATAHRMQEMIDRGDVDGPAELARRLGVSRARITQILDLTLLAPEIQDALLGPCRGVDRPRRVTPALHRVADWSSQRALWSASPADCA